MIEYIDGGVKVTLSRVGLKTRTILSNEPSQFPEQLDIKVTNWCNAGCSMCHEDSVGDGKQGDLSHLQSILEELPPGRELAIGGGNPLGWPHLNQFLVWAQQQGLICNITILEAHAEKAFERLCDLQDRELIWGIGISSMHVHPTMIGLQNVCKHLIVGLTDVKNILSANIEGSRILFLGYKNWGRGANLLANSNHRYRISSRFITWQHKALSLIHSLLSKGCIVSFDNLALEQLKLKEKLSPELLAKFYMGDEGSYSMYIDAVKEEYAITSYALERTSFQDCSLSEFFQRNRPL